MTRVASLALTSRLTAPALPGSSELFLPCMASFTGRQGAGIGTHQGAPATSRKRSAHRFTQATIVEYHTESVGQRQISAITVYREGITIACAIACPPESVTILASSAQRQDNTVARQALPKDTELHSRYRVETVLGAGGFGITYVGQDLHLNRAVAIKEYFPTEFALREGHYSVRSLDTGNKQFFALGRTWFLRRPTRSRNTTIPTSSG